MNFSWPSSAEQRKDCRRWCRFLLKSLYYKRCSIWYFGVCIWAPELLSFRNSHLYSHWWQFLEGRWRRMAEPLRLGRTRHLVCYAIKRTLARCHPEPLILCLYSFISLSHSLSLSLPLSVFIDLYTCICTYMLTFVCMWFYRSIYLYICIYINVYM